MDLFTLAPASIEFLYGATYAEGCRGRIAGGLPDILHDTLHQS